MPDTDKLASARRPGRPVTGEALTSTERNRLRRARLAQQDGCTLGSVNLSGPAAAALEQLRAGGDTIDEAVSRALIALASGPAQFDQPPLAPFRNEAHTLSTIPECKSAKGTA